MRCSLPKAYDFTPNGQAVPDHGSTQLIGQNVNLDELTAAIETLKHRLEKDFFQPLMAWMDAFREAQVCVKSDCF